jgi:hypothetical protein
MNNENEKSKKQTNFKSNDTSLKYALTFLVVLVGVMLVVKMSKEILKDMEGMGL